MGNMAEEDAPKRPFSFNRGAENGPHSARRPIFVGPPIPASSTGAMVGLDLLDHIWPEDDRIMTKRGTGLEAYDTPRMGCTYKSGIDDGDEGNT